MSRTLLPIAGVVLFAVIARADIYVRSDKWGRSCWSSGPGTRETCHDSAEVRKWRRLHGIPSPPAKSGALPTPTPKGVEWYFDILSHCEPGGWNCQRSLIGPYSSREMCEQVRQWEERFGTKTAGCWQSLLHYGQ